jgi:hypothetical protein
VTEYLFPVGRLRLSAEVGTILGPDTGRELYVVSGREGDYALISRATPHNLEAALAAPDFPRSVTEAVQARARG